MGILSVNHIEELCKELHMRPLKSMSQNFLIDGAVLADIMRAVQLGSDDCVLEIGSGFGALTERLVEQARKVVAIEKDVKLFDYLNKWAQNKQITNLQLLAGDFIKDFFGSVAPQLDRDYKVAANLPYAITSRVLRILLEADKKPKMVVVMVQKEVAERICARPGKMSILAVMCQYYGVPQIVRLVTKDCFYPAPEVDSAILKINVKEKARSNVFDGQFFKIVRVGFANKRKMLKNNLTNIYGKEKSEKAIKECGLNEKVRAEELGVENWQLLANELEPINSK